MLKIVLIATLSIASHHAIAERLPCDVLKGRLDAELQAKGVQIYTLEIVSADASLSPSQAASGVAASTKVIQGKQVGTCDGGTKRLIYTRGN